MAKKNARAKMISNLSVHSRRPYFVRSLWELWMCPPIFFSSSCVSPTTFEEDTKTEKAHHIFKTWRRKSYSSKRPSDRIKLHADRNKTYLKSSLYLTILLSYLFQIFVQIMEPISLVQISPAFLRVQPLNRSRADIKKHPSLGNSLPSHGTANETNL